MREVVFAATTPGLEPALEKEARGLGEVRVLPGGAEIRAGPGLHRRAILWLRTANRVLLRVAELPAGGPKEARRALAAVDLSPFRPAGAPLGIEVSSHHGHLGRGTLARLAGEAWNARGSGDPLSVLVRADETACTVSVDAGGAPLYRRGWRQEVSRAPLRETLAAGLLLLAGWRGERPLWDPFCGSGTIPIEAALSAMGRAPGLGRRFAFEGWPGHDAAAWDAELATARAGEVPLRQPVWASDFNAGALGTTRRNARRAGVDGALHLFRHDATDLPAGLPPGGLVAGNLPFGRRVERDPALHRRFGAVLARLSGWRYALLVEGAAERELGLRPERAIPLDNGGLHCRLLVGGLP